VPREALEEGRIQKGIDMRKELYSCGFRLRGNVFREGGKRSDFGKERTILVRPSKGTLIYGEFGGPEWGKKHNGKEVRREPVSDLINLPDETRRERQTMGVISGAWAAPT